MSKSHAPPPTIMKTNPKFLKQIGMIVTGIVLTRPPRVIPENGINTVKNH